MREYEIRLSAGRGSLHLFATGRYFTDSAAILAAERLCRAGETIEVWRGDVRIFAGLPRPKITMVWPVKAARI
ncbi:MAG TPA: hypothetical protein VNW15_08180 [Rhizomicrobium sp.]|jgi:hypothetical protein|nr:hypothetical protein [Rhizomicrobium sp.]